MVKALHAAGIEVILDVVYNHTAEGNQLGPTLSPARHRQRRRTTACRRRTAALLHRLHRLRQHAQHDASARAAADHGQPALLGARDARRWVPIRSRQRARPRAVRGGPARRLLRHHPSGSGALAGQVDCRAVGPRRTAGIRSATSRCCGPNGTAATATAVRRFWRGDGGTVAELATRLAGSSDLYAHNGRRPYASINFVTAHDGFTLTTSSSTSRNTTRPTAKTIVTARITI